nr:MAG TPA: hypothetical protein [Caudoviricetes sp.]
MGKSYHREYGISIKKYRISETYIDNTEKLLYYLNIQKICI